MACEQAGARGPPFAPSVPGPGWSWLPWNWYSLGGTGWCYDESWDELVKCDELDTPPDWYGIRRAAGAPIDTLWDARLLLLLGAGALALAWIAFREWAARDLGAAASAGTGPRDWLHSGRAWPWAWEPRARGITWSVAVGVACGLALPLPPDVFGRAGCGPSLAETLTMDPLFEE